MTGPAWGAGVPRRAFSRSRVDGTPRDSPSAQFVECLLERVPNVAVGWRQYLDPLQTGSANQATFLDCCKQISYVGSPARAWADLDRGSTGRVTLSDLDWRGAAALGSFAKKLETVFGSIEEACRRMGFMPGKKIRREKFCDLMAQFQVAAPSEAFEVFALLTEPQKKTVTSTLPSATEYMVVTFQGFAWLESLQPTLPRHTRDRVPPGGELGNELWQDGQDSKAGSPLLKPRRENAIAENFPLTLCPLRSVSEEPVWKRLHGNQHAWLAKRYEAEAELRKQAKPAVSSARSMSPSPRTMEHVETMLTYKIKTQNRLRTRTEQLHNQLLGLGDRQPKAGAQSDSQAQRRLCTPRQKTEAPVPDWQQERDRRYARPASQPQRGNQRSEYLHSLASVRKAKREQLLAEKAEAEKKDEEEIVKEVRRKHSPPPGRMTKAFTLRDMECEKRAKIRKAEKAARQEMMREEQAEPGEDPTERSWRGLAVGLRLHVDAERYEEAKQRRRERHEEEHRSKLEENNVHHPDRVLPNPEVWDRLYQSYSRHLPPQDRPESHPAETGHDADEYSEGAEVEEDAAPQEGSAAAAEGDSALAAQGVRPSGATRGPQVSAPIKLLQGMFQTLSDGESRGGMTALGPRSARPT